MKKNIDQILGSLEIPKIEENKIHQQELQKKLEFEISKKSPWNILEIVKKSLFEYSFVKVISAVVILIVLYTSFFGPLKNDIAHGEEAENPELLPHATEDQVIYPSRFVSPKLSFFKRAEWNGVSVPEEWINQGYYYEIWDSFNKPISGFKAKKLTEDYIDLTDVDHSDKSTLRFVLFVSEEESFHVRQDVVFSWNIFWDVRLVVIVAMTLTILFLLLVFGLIYKLSNKDILSVLAGSTYQSRKPELVKKVLEKGSQKNVALALFFVVFAGAGFFGATIGSFMGGQQILSVLIKFPVLLFGTYLISALIWYLLSISMAKSATFVESTIIVLLFLSRFVLVLVSTIPILLFFIASRLSHDAIFVVIIGILLLASYFAFRYFFEIYKAIYQKSPSFWIITLWVAVYIFIALQFAWMLRPWVGLVGPYEEYLPFVRLYSGNAFEELFRLFGRVFSGRAL